MASYKTAIAFGLIYIPIALNLVIKDNDIGFNMLDKKTGSRIRYKKTCDACDNKEVKTQDIMKGYEYEENKYVTFNEEDFEKLKTKKDKNIVIEQFVDIKEIDPIYYDKSYYVVPLGAENAFKLLLTALEQEGKVGIAKTVLRDKETLIALRVLNGQMILNTMFFYEEVQNNILEKSKIKVNKKELALAKLLIKNMTAPLKIENYHDEYNKKVQKAIKEKIMGKEIMVVEEEKFENVTNIMDALEQSLKQNIKPRAKA